MGQQKRVFPAELELKILKILWREGPLRVREVRRHLADEGRELAHTTVVTTLNKMVAKGFAESTQELNAYIFEACVSEEDVSQGMLSDFVDRVFDGSAVSLLLNLVESEDIEDEEFVRLRKLINKQAKKQTKGKGKK